MHKNLVAISTEIEDEVTRASRMWPAMDNAYEGFGVLLEEVDEFKAHAWMNQKKRDLAAMRTETIQIAAMAVRFLHDIGHYGIPTATASALRVAEHDTEVQNPIHSAHEGYIRLLSRIEQMKRDLFMGSLHVEHGAIQVAAMAMRICNDVCDGAKGRV